MHTIRFVESVFPFRIVKNGNVHSNQFHATLTRYFHQNTIYGDARHFKMHYSLAVRTNGKGSKNWESAFGSTGLIEMTDSNAESCRVYLM